MRKIDFIQGYYKWDVYVDDTCIFSFQNEGGGIGKDFYGVESYLIFIRLVDHYIVYMLRMLHIIRFELTDEEIIELSGQIIDKWERRYIDGYLFV